MFNFGRYKVTVHKATHLMSIQRAALQIEASKHWEGEKELSVEEALLRYDETNLYPALIACSTGTLPETYAEFAKMNGEDIDTWTEQAIKLNPRWFPLELSEQEKESEEKKTEKEPMT